MYFYDFDPWMIFVKQK